jgi:hypothetical protein
LGATLWAEDTNSPLETFQRFTTGNVPIKDAVVYRKYSRPDGKLIDEEWMRFGYQEGTWFVFRLTRETNNPSLLVPLDYHVVCGASLDQLWTISSKNFHVADKEFATGSVPDRYGAFSRDFMWKSLALGIPCLENTNIQWAGTNFTTTVASKRNAVGEPTERASLIGALRLGADGLPAGGSFSSVGGHHMSVVTYEHAPDSRGIPKTFTVKFMGPDPAVFRYEFLSLTLGKVSLEDTGGYVPMMFGDPGHGRKAMFWVGTNTLEVDTLDVRLPAITTLRTNSLSFIIPKQTGSSRQ